jgi:hypothetical protein
MKDEDRCIVVVALDEEGARKFVVEWLGVPLDRIACVEDAGPNTRPEKYKPEAREWRIFLTVKRA